MSLGILQDNKLFYEALKYATDNWVIIIAAALFTEYDENNGYIGGSIKSISIEDGAYKKVYFEEAQNKFKFFLWDSLDTLIPLTQSRERGVP